MNPIFEKILAPFMPDTRKQNSRDAYESVKPRIGAIQNQIMCALRNEPGTFYEIADRAGLEPQQVWKRMSELHKAGLVKPFCSKKGPNGRSVTVWRKTI